VRQTHGAQAKKGDELGEEYTFKPKVHHLNPGPWTLNPEP